MTPSVVGETVNASLLRQDWHEKLPDSTLAAYVRYQFVWLKTGALDWDSPEHGRVRKNWDGGVNSFGTKFKNRWPEAVRTLREHNAAPGAWVHAQFSPVADLRLNPVTSGLPEIQPAHLYAKSAAQVYGKYLQAMPEILWQRYEIAGSTLRARMSAVANMPLAEDEKELYVLCDESYVSASPFFRHVFAFLAGCESALELYLWEAALDYEANQVVYDAAIEKYGETGWLTAPLLQAVTVIREHWETYRGD